MNDTDIMLAAYDERMRGAAGFVAEEPETVRIGLAGDLATTPVLPEGVTLRQVAADAGMRRIAAMESAVWGQDWSWLADDLIARIAAAAAMEPVILPARLIDSPPGVVSS